uniref:Secreted protein n=1 Tax=Rhipicephalus appendiculatus TaxID=34631 RepID=A0A131YBM6_RHIAP
MSLLFPSMLSAFVLCTSSVLKPPARLVTLLSDSLQGYTAFKFIEALPYKLHHLAMQLNIASNTEPQVTLHEERVASCRQHE